MSELTLFLIRVAYLAILWIFVLSAISVIRSDMFGARVPEAARGVGGKAPKQKAPPKRRGSPTQVVVTQGSNTGATASLAQAPILIGRGNDAAIKLDDDYVSTRHARIAASGDQWFVEDLGSTNGTYIGTVRITQPTTDHARHPGPDRQDHPRAEEIDERPAALLLRDLRRGQGPQGQPGLRVRRALAAHRLRRGRAARRAATSPPRPRSPSCASSTSRRRTAPTSSPGSPTRCTRRTARSAAWSTRTPRSTAPAPPRPSRCSTASRVAIGHVGDSRAYLFREGEISQLTTDHTFVQSLIDEGRITEEEARVHPHRNLILKALDGIHDAEPDLFMLELVAGDRLFLCSDGACGVLPDGRIADILSMGTPDYAAVELVRASLEAGSSDNVTCVVADVITAEQAADDEQYAALEPLLVGAAAELKRRLPRGPVPRPPLRRHRRAGAGRRRDPRRPPVRDQGRPDRPGGGALRAAAAAPVRVAQAAARGRRGDRPGLDRGRGRVVVVAAAVLRR